MNLTLQGTKHNLMQFDVLLKMVDCCCLLVIWLLVNCTACLSQKIVLDMSMMCGPKPLCCLIEVGSALESCLRTQSARNDMQDIASDMQWNAVQ